MKATYPALAGCVLGVFMAGVSLWWMIAYGATFTALVFCAIGVCFAPLLGVLAWVLAQPPQRGTGARADEDPVQYRRRA